MNRFDRPLRSVGRTMIPIGIALAILSLISLLYNSTVGKVVMMIAGICTAFVGAIVVTAAETRYRERHVFSSIITRLETVSVGNVVQRPGQSFSDLLTNASISHTQAILYLSSSTTTPYRVSGTEEELGKLEVGMHITLIRYWWSSTTSWKAVVLSTAPTAVTASVIKQY